MKTRYSLLAALPLLLTACATGAPAPAGDLLAIIHATVIDGTGAAPAADRTLLVRGRRIVRIGGADEVRIPAGARVVDARGAFAIPGLWDMHVHALWDTTVAERFLPAFVANGVTGVRDMGGSLDVLRYARGRIAAGTLTAPRIVAAGSSWTGRSRWTPPYPCASPRPPRRAPRWTRWPARAQTSSRSTRSSPRTSSRP
jgi:hypothetical protein